ncbi:MAG: hypothetical protein P4L73_03050 [Caulobacteraceae bacterium]|nr:hypothetical protein [Caulobacteraceae bacterium]
MPNPLSFDNAAVASATRQFANRLGADRRFDSVERIEVTLSGRGPIERLFAVEAALLAHWPEGLRRPPHDLVSSTGELSPADEQAGLTLRAFDPEGAVVLREVYDIGAAGKPLKAAAPTHG